MNCTSNKSRKNKNEFNYIIVYKIYKNIRILYTII